MCSGDFLRIEICPCENLLIICTGRSKVNSQGVEAEELEVEGEAEEDEAQEADYTS